MACGTKKSKAKAAPKACPQRQTRARAKLANAAFLMKGLDHRGLAIEKLPDDPEPLTYAEALERNPKAKTAEMGAPQNKQKKLKKTTLKIKVHAVTEVADDNDFGSRADHTFPGPASTKDVPHSRLKRKTISGDTTDEPPPKKAKVSGQETFPKSAVASDTNSDSDGEASRLTIHSDDGSDDGKDSAGIASSPPYSSTAAINQQALPSTPVTQPNKEDRTSTSRSAGSGGDSLVPLPAELPEPGAPKLGHSMNTMFHPKKIEEYAPDHDRQDTYDPVRPQAIEIKRCPAEYQPDHSDDGEEYDPSENSAPQKSPQSGDESDHPTTIVVDCLDCWALQSTGAPDANCLDCKLEINQRLSTHVGPDYEQSQTVNKALGWSLNPSLQEASYTTDQNLRLRDLRGPDAGCWDARHCAKGERWDPSGPEYEEDDTDWEDDEFYY